MYYKACLLSDDEMKLSHLNLIVNVYCLVCPGAQFCLCLACVREHERVRKRVMHLEIVELLLQAVLQLLPTQCPPHCELSGALTREEARSWWTTVLYQGWCWSLGAGRGLA
jgi:hypothetical protein